MIADSSTLIAEKPMKRVATILAFTVTLMCGLTSQAGAQFASAFDRTITFANRPRWVDPKAAGATPYPGWPITVRQEAR
jgi:hypothetical protein